MAKSKKRLPWYPAATAAENAARLLPVLTEAFFEAGRGVTHSPPSIDDLHRLRLKVKRFRYTLELFRPCYGPGLEKRLEALKQMQEHLGAMNDCQTASVLFGVEGAGELPDAGVLRRFLDARLAEKQEAFLRHWQETFDAEGQLQWWTDYLKNTARRGGLRDAKVTKRPR